MWYYGVFGKQRDESGCGKDICTYAKKRIDKFHQCCSADGFDGVYVGWDWVVKFSLRYSARFCGIVHVSLCLIEC
jgi:hypothetical protein